MQLPKWLENPFETNGIAQLLGAYGAAGMQHGRQRQSAGLAPGRRRGDAESGGMILVGGLAAAIDPGVGCRPGYAQHPVVTVCAQPVVVVSQSRQAADSAFIG